jgi:hypothetical protein
MAGFQVTTEAVKPTVPELRSRRQSPLMFNGPQREERMYERRSHTFSIVYLSSFAFSHFIRFWTENDKRLPAA